MDHVTCELCSAEVKLDNIVKHKQWHLDESENQLSLIEIVKRINNLMSKQSSAMLRMTQLLISLTR